MSLSNQIEKTKDRLEDFGMMPHEEESDEIVLKNQIEIMKALLEIKDDLRRVKKRVSPGNTY
jgi:hypothetical protein